MFQIKINNDEKEKDYLVFGEKEFNIIFHPTTHCISCPNYYELNVIPGERPVIQCTNIEPIIIEDNPITNNGFNTINISFGEAITPEEYETLYELYLEQMKENPTPEYLKEQEIKEDIERAKKLVKKTKRA